MHGISEDRAASVVGTEAARLPAWVSEARITPRFRTPRSGS
ncbi:hypothetical protein [Streptomyces sp. AK02-01A]|nr:hypothetical protein [Streptomyces sp. AK02-01A]MDX3852963.1 hypothetical protein [Streptomyces sp. AK02-01A]